MLFPKKQNVLSFVIKWYINNIIDLKQGELDYDSTPADFTRLIKNYSSLLYSKNDEYNYFRKNYEKTKFENCS